MYNRGGKGGGKGWLKAEPDPEVTKLSHGLINKILIQ